MIKLRKNNITMEVSTQVQASAFLKSGWNIVDSVTEVIKPVEKVETVEQVEQKPQYTKTDINRMSTSDLQKLALDNSVDNAKKFTGSELKKILIKKLCK